ncbi:hypothetical protein RJ640_016889 [Escallonia rubra]|uniref:Protein kinase domain-containing protein n=1 Tax=Escallonia rubra TaxID=112253 RepID=A0AA88RE51_9ASTE|nr:hypothetical protein RJ640_016889 [Escallonia rubra]
MMSGAGKLHNDEWVAIKKLRHQDTEGIKQIMNEINVLSSVSRPNLVRLLGCCVEKGEHILVYEYMPNGTLSQHQQRGRDYNFNSEVADFGLCRLVMTDDSHISTAPQGNPFYVDPQYHQNLHLYEKSDVYSFGVVLVEIITTMKMVDFWQHHTEINLAALGIDIIGKCHVDEIIDTFLDPYRDAWTLTSIHKVAELAFRCLAFHRGMREIQEFFS